MAQYDFSIQEELFNIANQILIDYNIQDWSFDEESQFSL